MRFAVFMLLVACAEARPPPCNPCGPHMPSGRELKEADCESHAWTVGGRCNVDWFEGTCVCHGEDGGVL